MGGNISQFWSFIFFTVADINWPLMGGVLCPLVVRDTHFYGKGPQDRDEVAKSAFYPEVSGYLSPYLLVT